MSKLELVVLDGGSRWSIHPAGYTDEQCLSGEAPVLCSGTAYYADDEYGTWMGPDKDDWAEARKADNRREKMSKHEATTKSDDQTWQWDGSDDHANHPKWLAGHSPRVRDGVLKITTPSGVLTVAKGEHIVKSDKGVHVTKDDPKKPAATASHPSSGAEQSSHPTPDSAASTAASGRPAASPARRASP